MTTDNREYADSARSGLRKMLFCSLVLGGLVWMNGTRADENNLELKGTLVVPPACTLNGDNTLYVSFGDNIGINKVASGIYREPVNPGLVCEESYLSWSLVLTVTGTAAAFDSEKATVVSTEYQ